MAGLALGLLIALTANLAYAVPRGPVVVGLGLVAPLVLPVVLHLRSTFTVEGFWKVAVRELSTLAVAGPAVAISYVHTFELVLGAGEPWLLAVLAPLSSDGLAGLATLALYQAQRNIDRGRQKTDGRTTLATEHSEAAQPTSAPAPPESEQESDSAGVEDRPLQLVRAAEPNIPEGRPARYDEAVRASVETNVGAKTLMKDFGLSEHYAKQARAEAVRVLRGA